MIAVLTLDALTAIWVAVAPVLADYLVVEKPLQKADVIVILSGAADYAQRARGGSEAYRDAIAPKILITNDGLRGGWDDKEKDNPYFIDRMYAALVNEGVPESSIERLSDKIHGTDEEADLIIRTVSGRGYRSLLIVTSDFHSRRALWTFERAVRRNNADVSLGLVRAPADDRYPDRRFWWLSLRGGRSVAGEYLKLGYYWLYY